MEAKDFLAQNKRRILRLGFPDFPVYDSFGGLLDVHLSEAMSDSPDVEIGNLVIPELSVTLEHTNMKKHLGSRMDVSIGLEQSREDISAEIQAIQNADTSGKLSFARSANGCWFVGAGKKLYSCWFDADGTVHLDYRLDFEQDISAVCMLEERVDLDSSGRVTDNHGIVYLFFEMPPYLRRFGYVGFTPLSDFQYTGFGGISEIGTPEITDPLHLAVVKDIARKHIGITRSVLCRNAVPVEEQIQTADIRYSGYYRASELVRNALSGELTTFVPASFGEFTMTEAASQDEETTELLCYGILGEIAGLDAKPFLNHSHFRTAQTFAEIYSGLVKWLNQNGFSVRAASQTYLNLDKIPVVHPDGSPDDSHITIGDMLRELAMLEGGNARMNHDQMLELGWCGTEPVMTISAETLSAMRIGTERLTAAEGMTFLNPQSENVIGTSMDEKGLYLSAFTDADAYTEAFGRIVGRFSKGLHIPFSADVLTGASPFLRAGDSLRMISRSGAVVSVQVFMQELEEFPFLKSHISTPDGTKWRTEPVDFYWMEVVRITVENWPEYIIDGEIPDTSGMTVTAVMRNDDTFTVSSELYQVTARPLSGYPDIAIMTVTFLGKTQTQDVKVYYPLYTNDGKPLLTDSGEMLVVKEKN